MLLPGFGKALLLLAGFMPALLLAAEPTEVPGVKKNLSASPVGAEQLASVTMGLLLVLALIFALAWLYRRYGNFTPFNRADIQVIGGVSLGSREKAVLLDVDGTRLLVGVASGSVNTLHVFDSSSPSAETTMSPVGETFAQNLNDQIEQASHSEDVMTDRQKETPS